MDSSRNAAVKNPGGAVERMKKLWRSLHRGLDGLRLSSSVSMWAKATILMMSHAPLNLESAYSTYVRMYCDSRALGNNTGPVTDPPVPLSCTKRLTLPLGCESKGKGS